MIQDSWNPRPSDLFTLEHDSHLASQAKIETKLAETIRDEPCHSTKKNFTIKLKLIVNDRVRLFEPSIALEKKRFNSLDACTFLSNPFSNFLPPQDKFLSPPLESFLVPDTQRLHLMRLGETGSPSVKEQQLSLFHRFVSAMLALNSLSVLRLMRQADRVAIRDLMEIRRRASTPGDVNIACPRRRWRLVAEDVDFIVVGVHRRVAART